MLKQNVFDLLDQSEEGGKLEKSVNALLLVLIALNVIVSLSESMITNAQVLRIFHGFEIVSIVIFSIEYILRLWVADRYYPEKPRWKARLRYAVSAMALIDLCAILPFFLPLFIKIDLRALRILRLFRFMRLLKTNRYSNSMSLVIEVLKRKSSELASSIMVVVVMIIMAAALMFSVENAAQPDRFRTMGDALWWASATFTTVGYGDIYPITVLGRILSSIISILGIGIVAIPTGILAGGFIEIVNKKNFCPHCGKEIK